MQTVKEAASEFLAHKRIAVTGVSRTPKEHGSNTVFKRLRDHGYQVFAVNPNANEVENVQSYHDLRSIPGGEDAVVSATATAYGRKNGITVIDGGCPLMFDPVADFGHKVMRFGCAGHVPKSV